MDMKSIFCNDEDANIASKLLQCIPYEKKTKKNEVECRSHLGVKLWDALFKATVKDVESLSAADVHLVSVGDQVFVVRIFCCTRRQFTATVPTPVYS